jgi:hypothetical protein
VADERGADAVCAARHGRRDAVGHVHGGQAVVGVDGESLGHGRDDGAE